MKKLFATTVLITLFTISANSQPFQNSEEGRLIDDFELVSIGKLSRKVPPNTLGSPYITKAFMPAKVGDTKANGLMRYDAYNDEFEFINAKKDTLVLNKNAKFTTIIFPNTNTKYQLANYTNKKGNATTGYLVELYGNNGYVLYKKQVVNYTKEEVAERPFEKSSPAKFEQAADVFYFREKEKEIAVFPTSKKALLKHYPAKKTELETFVKQNNIDFDKEADIKKLIDFLSQS